MNELIIAASAENEEYAVVSPRVWRLVYSPLVPLVVLAAAVAILWAIAVPPWRPNDEPQHFGYIQYLSQNQSVPYPGDAWLGEDIVISHNTTNFFGMVGKEETNIDPGQAVMPAASGDPPLYYALMLPAYWASAGGSVETQMYAVRLFSTVIFILLTVAAYEFAKLVFPKAPYFQLGVPLLMIFHPQLLFIFTSVTNDSLLALLFTLMMYQLILLAQRGPDNSRAVKIGLLLGFGMLTKLSFLVACPLTLAVIAVLFVKRRDQWQKLMHLILIILAVSTVVCGWYYLKRLTHESLQPGIADPTKGLQYGSVGLYQLLKSTGFNGYIIATFIGTFSWVPLPGYIFIWFRHAIQLATIGLLISLVAGFWYRGWETIKPWLVLLLGATVLVFFMAAAVFELQVGSAQGRYLFPAVVPFWCLFLAGIAAFVPPRLRPRLIGVLVAVFALFGTWSLFVEFIGRST